MDEMSSWPLVSVAIITYNQLNFLKECISSVVAQDYPNIEIVVADDGSTDGTPAFLLACKNQGARPFVLRLSPTNHGITANCNAAHFACSGKYTAWIGGDDMMLPTKISEQVQFLESHPEHALCHHRLEIFDNATGKILLKKMRGTIPRTGDIRTVVRHGPINGGSSTMVRTSCAPLSGYDLRVPIASDWLYWVDTLSSGKQIGYIDKVLGRHRRHDNNVTKFRESVARIEIIQDGLVSCILIVSKYPRLANLALYRCAHLLLEIRHLENSRYYADFLHASLAVQVTAKAIVGSFLNALFGYRR